MGTASNGCKAPAIEAYGEGRYFALTGEHVAGTPDGSPTQRQRGPAWPHGSPLLRRAFCPGGGGHPSSILS